MNFKHLFIVFTVLVSGFSFSQKQLTVLDDSGLEPMPFVKIFPDTGKPFYTNVDGSAYISDSITSIKLSFTGFNDTTIVVGDSAQLIVQMKSTATTFNEVVVLPGVNPALRIIENAIENRKINHPLKNDAFTYESYSKFLFDVDTILQNKIKNTPYNPDDTVINKLRTQHIFLLESATERTFIPPSKDKETITAYKISGLNNPLFSSFAQTTQTFHFYDNQFELLQNKYLSPIAFGAPSKYFYLIKDTTINGTDTTFIISFRPRPETKVDCMKGVLYINTNKFALERIIAEPAKESGGMKIKIIQEYQFVDGKKWFPVNLKTIADLKGLQYSIGKENGYLVGKGTTYISNIKINPDNLKKTGFNNLNLTTDLNAGKKTDEDWATLRKDSLTDRDANTYHVLDSLSQANNFDKKLNTLIALMTGKIVAGPVAFPINRVIDYNLHEGYRLGLGLETSERLMQNIVVGGYFAWGTKDKDWKYGGYSLFHLNKRLGMSIGLKFQQDVINRGSNAFSSAGWDLTSPQLLTNFYQRYMDRQRLAEINYTISPLGNLSFNLLGNYQRIDFTHKYQYTDLTGVNYDKKIDVAEIALETKWNIRQRTFMLGTIKMPQPTKYPRFQFKIAKGISGIAQSKVDYWRLYIAMDEDFSGLRWGKFNLHLDASQSFGDVPMLFKQYNFGTRRDWGVVTSNVMETAYPGEFYHVRQATLIVRYTTPAIKSKKKWFAPEFTFHHGLAYGDFSNSAQHNVTFWTMEKGLFEGGLIISGIINYRIIKLGAGVFYRYGHYSDPNAVKNLVPKISITISNLQQLGGN
ncbi:MAG: DUF5686 and carboxypeptidase regulatory-like domain-containing protein [Crocinitomicaceae bacterium]|nr:DUF5686 and carboxypeptidase regulatory-like domain-containing protein [Crocinitomicaceae bacterium]